MLIRRRRSSCRTGRRLGEILWRGNALQWLPMDGEVQSLASDRDGAPTIVAAGDCAFFVIERDGRFAVRVRDLAWAVRTPLPALIASITTRCGESTRPGGRLDPPQVMEVPNVTGN